MGVVIKDKDPKSDKILVLPVEMLSQEDGLIKEDTKIIIDETVVNPNADAVDVKQPLPLPQGVSELALAQPVPKPELTLAQPVPEPELARSVPEPELGWLILLLVGVFGGECLIRRRDHGWR